MTELKPDLECIAFMDLKSKIVKLMFEFTDKYTGTNNANNLYPITGDIIVDVLTACLEEARMQVSKKEEDK